MIKDVTELKTILYDEESEYMNADHELRVRCLDKAESLPGTVTALDKVMAYLRMYGEEFTPYVRGDLYFAGTPGKYHIHSREGGLVDDIGHYCADYKKLADFGIEGIREELNRTVPSDAESAKVRAAYNETLDLFVSYMRKHESYARELAEQTDDGEKRANLLRMAEDISFICANRPRTFAQGLQLILFAHCYVFVKPHTNTVTLGNLDRVLETLYQSELTAGTLTREKALDIICRFYLSFITMDRDTQNIVLGGSDENGNLFENDLTVLFLRAQEILHLEEPSVSLKIRPDTSDRVWNAALDLLAKGGGMPSFLNDPLYIRALKLAGFPEKEANTFCNVGCYEATPYGNTFGGTVGGDVKNVSIFADFFALSEDYPDFESFIAGWEHYLEDEYKNVLVPRFAKKKEIIGQRSAGPFLGLIMDGCIENLRLPEQYGARHNIISILFEGIGTVTDSLLCVKHFVYDTKEISLDSYRRAVAENYPDGRFLAKVRAYPARFGSGDPESGELAKREAEFMSDLAAKYPVNEHIKSVPALFRFTADIYSDKTPATPDGRRAGDRFSYGAAASELLPRRDTTKVLMSTAGLPLERFPIGAPMTVNLTADVLKTEKGRDAVRTMVETYHREGGTHIQFNIADPDVLRDAQLHPDRYRDLLIRISGHTEPFIRLNKTMQDALIARAGMGC